MNRFPTPQIHLSQRRALHDVRLAFNRIVARMRGLARSTQDWPAAELPAPRPPAKRRGTGSFPPFRTSES